MFIVVVFVGIELGSRGAKISKLEIDIEKELSQKINISETVFREDKTEDNKIAELGFAKPTEVAYFDIESVTAKR